MNAFSSREDLAYLGRDFAGSRRVIDRKESVITRAYSLDA